MPTWLQQLIVQRLLDRFRDHLRSVDSGGEVLMAPLPTRLFERTIREPDLLYVREENLPQDVRGYPEKLDLAVEIVSAGSEARKRDYDDKRNDYAKAGVSEYWIVDPQEKLVTVLTLAGDHYVEHGVYPPGQIATSKLLSGLAVPVDEIWALGQKKL